MAILYTVIARGSTVLAQFASCAGNFSEVAYQILSKLSGENSKMTYSHGKTFPKKLPSAKKNISLCYLFHYICDNRIVYMAITEDDFERSRVFKYLADIRKRFMAAYGKHVHIALPHSMDSEFSSVLMSQMHYYNKPPEKFEKVDQIQEEVDELKEIMVKNIDSIANRGDNLNLLVDKTEHLSDSSVTFLKRSTNLERSLRCKNYKLIALIAFVALVLILIIISSACGGVTWPKCVHKKPSNNTGYFLN